MSPVMLASTSELKNETAVYTLAPIQRVTKPREVADSLDVEHAEILVFHSFPAVRQLLFVLPDRRR